MAKVIELTIEALSGRLARVESVHSGVGSRKSLAPQGPSAEPPETMNKKS